MPIGQKGHPQYALDIYERAASAPHAGPRHIETVHCCRHGWDYSCIRTLPHTRQYGAFTTRVPAARVATRNFGCNDLRVPCALYAKLSAVSACIYGSPSLCTWSHLGEHCVCDHQRSDPICDLLRRSTGTSAHGQTWISSAARSACALTACQIEEGCCSQARAHKSVWA